MCSWCCADFLRQLPSCPWELQLLPGGLSSVLPCGAAVAQFSAFTGVNHWLPVLGLFPCVDNGSKE